MQAQCLCGAVHVTAPTFLEVHVCHCTMCQRWNGGPGFSLELPQARRTALRLAEHQDVGLGIRPEAMAPATADTDTAHDRLDGIVEVVEPLGAETILGVDIGAGRIVARVQGHLRLRAGERVTLALDAGKLHVFDRASELNLALPT